MMLKILHNVEPNCCDIKFKVTPRHGDVAIIPSLPNSSSLRNQSLYDKSFAAQGPKLWNKVPHTVKAATSFDIFNFKCSLSDNPPVAGCSSALIGQTHWLTTRHPGGHISDDPSSSTDELNGVTR